MPIALVGSPPPPANYEDLISGNDRAFDGDNGNWTNSGGTLTHDATTAYAWPSTDTGSLKLVTTATSQYAELDIAGTFKADTQYVAWVCLTVEEASSCSIDVAFGLIGTDAETFSIATGTSRDPHVDGKHAMVMVRWIPSAARTGVKLRVTRTEASGTRTLHVAYAKVLRLPNNVLPVLGTPDSGATGPADGLAPVLMNGSSDVRLGIGGKGSGGISFLKSNGGMLFEASYDGTTVNDYNGFWMDNATGFGMSLAADGSTGDLLGKQFWVDVGPDSVGFYVSERDSGTVQFYSDGSGHQMQLRHRGSLGWSVSDDGTVNARIESFFQWEFTVSGTLTVNTDQCRHFQVPYKARIDEVRCHVGTAPTDASLIVDVNDDGTTIFTTQGNRPTIASTTTDDTSEAPDGGTAVAKDSVLTVDIDQVGSTVAGADLTVFVRGRYIW